MIARLSTFILALVFAGATSAYAQSVTPVSRLNVVDANGKLVGPVVTTNPELTVQVTLNFNGQTLLLTVGKKFITNTNFQSLWFDSADCTGKAFGLTDNSEGLFPNLLVGVPNMTVYLVQGPLQTTQLKSGSFLSDLPYRCENFDPFEVQYAISAQPLVDLSTRFTPPFSIR